MFPSPSKVANDSSTLNNEARAQTFNGPSVLYDQQHFSLYLYLNALCSSITLWMNFQPDDKMQQNLLPQFFFPTLAKYVDEKRIELFGIRQADKF